MLLERYLINCVENNPQEMKNLLLVLCRRLSCAEKQELIKEFLGNELFEALRWCVECRKNNLDFAKITEKI